MSPPGQPALLLDVMAQDRGLGEERVSAPRDEGKEGVHDFEIILFTSTDIITFSYGTRYTAGVQLRYSFRLYPTPGQQQALARAFGCARVVFNDALYARQQAHAAGLPCITDAELSARLTAAKATPERAWLGVEADRQRADRLKSFWRSCRKRRCRVRGTDAGTPSGASRRK